MNYIKSEVLSQFLIFIRAWPTLVYGPRPHRAAPGQGRGEKSKNLDQRHSWSNPASEPAASEWIGKTQTIREHRDEEINCALQREAMGLLAEQEKQYAPALGEAI